MADLIRTLEADLFGAYEWAAELYGELIGAPEAPLRLAVARGLLRAADAVEGKADDAMRAAEVMVEAEGALTPEERDALAPLDAARDALFASGEPGAARAFLDVFDAAWSGGPRAPLVPDAFLAALAASNVIASRGRATLPEAEVRALHARAATLYDEAGTVLRDAFGKGGTLWQETAAQAIHRQVVAWRLAGDEAKARRIAKDAPDPLAGRPKPPGN